MRFDVAIIGCGASGAVLATQLFRQAAGAISVCCVEPATRLGAGLAYGRCGEEHLLNVPASRISAIAGEDFDFVEWLDSRGLLQGEPSTFYAPRARYADYLTDSLGRSLRNSSHRHLIDHRPSRAVEMEPDGSGWRVRLASGERIETNAAVLALGNVRAPDPPAGLEALADDTRYLHDPWQLANRKLRRDRAVAIIGSGLTAVDVLQTLIHRGHRGAIEVVSRSGSWPAEHRSVRGDYAVRWPEGSLRQLLRELHRHLDAAEAEDWRDVIDSLRPHTQRLWRGLSDADKRRFRTRLAGRWGRARHRMPPEIGKALRQWQREGRFRLHAAGRLRAERGESEIHLRLSSDSAPLKIRRVINATGPLLDLRRSDDRLLSGLLADGRVRPGALGAGLDADGDGRLINRAGQPWPGLFVLGPLLAGNLLESTAMPEIKVQAFHLAATLLTGRAGAGTGTETETETCS